MRVRSMRSSGTVKGKKRSSRPSAPRPIVGVTWRFRCRTLAEDVHVKLAALRLGWEGIGLFRFQTVEEGCLLRGERAKGEGNPPQQVAVHGVREVAHVDRCVQRAPGGAQDGERLHE